MQILKSTKQQKLKSIESIFPKELQNNEIKKELDEIKTVEEKIERKDLFYKINECAFNFQQLEMIRSFGNSIVIGKMTLAEASKKQSSLLENMLEFINRARPNIQADKFRKKEEMINTFYLNAFKSGIFSLTPRYRFSLTLKQMLQRLSIALAQVQADNKFIKRN